jgi:O-antigen/teichoic acid export membrane protein
VSSLGLSLDTVLAFPTGASAASRPTALEKLLKLAGRYALSALGPVCISGAHFLGAVLILHTLSPIHFGLFSFVMTIVPFCISAAAALVGAPTTIGIRERGRVDAAELATFQKANLLLSLFAFAVVAGSLVASGLNLSASLLFGLYGATMSLRWLGRVYAYATDAPARAAASDIAYGTLLVAGLGALYLLDRMTMTYTAVVLLAAAAASLGLFDRAYLIRQFAPSAAGRLADYLPVWRDLTRWSLLGVAATELTINAHAYFVTFFSGPSAFALLALGSLLMRPVAVVLQSLPDMERPVMARAIGAGDLARAFRAVKEFRTAAVAVLLGTILIAAALLTWFPSTVLKQGYDAGSAALIVAVWAVLMAVRALRTPDAVFLQAAGQFKPLANVGMQSCLVSLAATLALLLAFGPIASLLGIVAGEIVMTAGIVKLVRRWKLAHA